MDNSYINIDLFNKSVTGRHNDVSFVFSSIEYFLSSTNFPYSETILNLNYEPSRNFYVVERTGGVFEQGPEVEELAWVANNENIIYAAAENDPNKITIPEPTVNDYRLQKLYETDWVLQRQQEQQLLGAPTTLSDELFQQVLIYRQQLRDMDTSVNLSDVVWPTNPLV